jgi:endonuclease III related protein
MPAQRPSIQASVSPGTTQHSGAARLRSLYELLRKAYGPQHWWPARTRFEVILGAYLTQNTAWTSVERSFARLRAAGAMTPAGIRRAALADLSFWIRPSGFATRKAPAIKAFVTLLDERFAGSLSRMARTPTASLRLLLLALPGVGPETADAILLYAFGHSVPVADEYLRRIAVRHELLQPAERSRASYNTLVQLTTSAFAGDAAATRARHFNEFHALVVAVGKAHCGSTPRCERCPLRGNLPAGSRPAK